MVSNTSRNLLDLLSEKDRKKVEQWERDERNPKFDAEVPPEIFILSRAMYYGDWQAVVDIKRGYIEDFDEETGKRKKIPLTLTEVVAILRGCDKVWYKKLVEQGRIGISSNIAARSECPDISFRKNAKAYIKAAGDGR